MFAFFIISSYLGIYYIFLHLLLYSMLSSKIISWYIVFTYHYNRYLLYFYLLVQYSIIYIQHFLLFCNKNNIKYLGFSRYLLTWLIYYFLCKIIVFISTFCQLLLFYFFSLFCAKLLDNTFWFLRKSFKTIVFMFISKDVF